MISGYIESFKKPCYEKLKLYVKLFIESEYMNIFARVIVRFSGWRELSFSSN